MQTIHIDFSAHAGKIKPMNAVNNGPTGMSERGTSNFLDYKALEIPYARNHDASFYYGYGGEHTVDVHRIFKNFDAKKIVFFRNFIVAHYSTGFALAFKRVHKCRTTAKGITIRIFVAQNKDVVCIKQHLCRIFYADTVIYHHC